MCATSSPVRIAPAPNWLWLTPAPVEGNWWQLYRDPVLDQLERRGRATACSLFRRHRNGFLGGLQVLVDAQDLGALLHETDDGRPPVAHAGSRALPGPDHDRDLVFQAHRPISLVWWRRIWRQNCYPQCISLR